MSFEQLRTSKELLQDSLTIYSEISKELGLLGITKELAQIRFLIERLP